jgi:type IV secretion system protein VirD4
VAEWGPRPGGAPAPRVAPAPTSNGCLSVLASFTAFLGFVLLGPAPTAGVVLLMLGGSYFGWLVLGQQRHNIALRNEKNRQEREVVAWRNSRPDVLAAQSEEPLREVRELTAAGGGGVFLGITPDYREWTTAHEQQAVLVLGPPRSGKTSGLIVPAILGSRGPVVSTSTKTDVLMATAATRSDLGRVWLFDPSGTEDVPDNVLELHWSPVQSSRTWDGARAIADAMVGASSAGAGVDNATFWTESAKALLAPLLHAAALSGSSVSDVRRWLARSDFETPGKVLEQHAAETAADDLDAIANTEERELSSILSTTRQVLHAYGSDAAAVRSRQQNFDAHTFVRSQDTVYITAPSHLQHLLAPLVVGLLEEIRLATYAAARQAANAGSRFPSVLWALDEVANMAPMRNLPSIVSEAGGQGLQVMACFQDLSQAKARWDKAADGFLTLFGTKVIFAGIGESGTLTALSTLAGDWDRPYTVMTTSNGTQRSIGFPFGAQLGSNASLGHQFTTQREARISAAEIANVPAGHALILRANRWGLVQVTPYYSAEPWTTVMRRAPASVQQRGGPDALQPPGASSVASADAAAVPEQHGTQTRSAQVERAPGTGRRA